MTADAEHVAPCPQPLDPGGFPLDVFPPGAFQVDAPALDEFDLDVVWGELGPHGEVDLYLPTGRDVPGETCDTHNPTCPDTCHGTCPNTCHGTCPDTCRATCRNTCRATCPNTCRATCEDTCQQCPTEAQTHCFTCRSGCQRP